MCITSKACFYKGHWFEVHLFLSMAINMKTPRKKWKKRTLLKLFSFGFRSRVELKLMSKLRRNRRQHLPCKKVAIQTHNVWVLPYHSYIYLSWVNRLVRFTCISCWFKTFSFLLVRLGSCVKSLCKSFCLCKEFFYFCFWKI